MPKKKNLVSTNHYLNELYHDESFEPTTKHINELYKYMLNTTLVLDINDKGVVCRTMVGSGKDGADELIPIEVNDKILALPTRDNLRNEDQDFQFFHPLSEGLMRGESLIVATMIKHITADINIRLSMIMGEYARAISSEEGVEAMNTGQLEIARRVGIKDAKFVTFINSVNKALITKFKDKEYPVSLFLKPKARIGGKNYNKGCIVNFELMDLYDEHDKTFLGVKETRKNKGYSKAIIDIFKEVLPDFDKINTYSYGTYSKVAPHMCALLGSWVKIRKEMDKFCKKHESLGLFEGMAKDLTWYGGVNLDSELFETKLETLTQLIPNLDGNIGSGGRGGDDVASAQDKEVLTNSLLGDGKVSISNREESASNKKEESVSSAPKSTINSAFLADKKPPSEGFGQQSSGFGNSSGGFGQQSGGFGGGSSGFGQQSGGFNNLKRGVSTRVGESTNNIPYSGIRL